MAQKVISKFFILNKMVRTFDKRWFYVKAVDGEVKLFTNSFIKKSKFLTDVDNRKESTYWRIVNGAVYIKSKTGLKKIPNQIVLDDYSYRTNPIIVGDIAFCCKEPLSYIDDVGNKCWKDSYFILQANDEGNYKNITSLYKTNITDRIHSITCHLWLEEASFLLETSNEVDIVKNILFKTSVINKIEYNDLVEFKGVSSSSKKELQEKFAHLL